MMSNTKTVATLLGMVFIAACTTNGPGHIELASGTGSLKTMEHIALTANQCWFKNSKSEFRPYRMAPELASYSGRPRILIVPRNNPGEKPLLVVEAEGEPAKVSAYGPLMSGPGGTTIADDLDRWTKGDNQC